MWIYKRRLSLTPRKMTFVKRGYTFTVSAEGVLLSSLTPEMESILRADPLWTFQGESAAEPVSEPVSEPAPEPAPELIPEPAPEPVSEPVSEPIPEPATEILEESSAEMVDSQEAEPPKRRRGRPKKM